MGYVKSNRRRYISENLTEVLREYKFPKDERTKEEKERDRRRMAKCVM